MPREPLPIGTYGHIATSKHGNVWCAQTRYRDADGRTRQVSARGPSKAAATRALKTKLATRTPGVDAKIVPSTRLTVLCGYYLDSRRIQVDTGRIQPATYDRDQLAINSHIRPTLGALRVEEATTRRLDRFIQKLSVDKPAQARLVRATLKAVFALATLEIPGYVNPVRETRTVKRPKPAPKALTPDDLRQLREIITAWQGEQQFGPSRGKDLPDLVTLAVATGLRIGELLALRWQDVDLLSVPATVSVKGTITVAKGKGAYMSASGWV